MPLTADAAAALIKCRQRNSHKGAFVFLVYFSLGEEQS